MQKPQGYDEVQIGGDFTPLELGGHHLIIKAVREQESKSGKPMIVVAFDCAKNDRQAGYFSDLFEKDIRPDKKWANNGTQYIVTLDADNKTSKSFKSFITAFERSNNVICEWGNKFCEQFKDKRIGGVFGIVEEEYNGEIKQRHKLRWFCEDSRVDGAKVPDAKLLEKSSLNNLVSVPAGTDEEIPF